MNIVLPEALRIGLMAGGLLLVIPGLAAVLHRYRKRHGVLLPPDHRRQVRDRDVTAVEPRERERDAFHARVPDAIGRPH